MEIYVGKIKEGRKGMLMWQGVGVVCYPTQGSQLYEDRGRVSGEIISGSYGQTILFSVGARLCRP